MGRKHTPQKRITKTERRIVAQLEHRVKTFPLSRDDSRKGEVHFNYLLLSHLRQWLEVRNKKIPSVDFFAERFRPDLYVGSQHKRLCAVECKKLKAFKSAKARWKEGLSQALVYSAKYKVVLLVLFDFTKDLRYYTALGRGNKPESTFATKLRRQSNVQIIALRPSDAQV